jgi:hypothetical protein
MERSEYGFVKSFDSPRGSSTSPCFVVVRSSKPRSEPSFTNHAFSTPIKSTFLKMCPISIFRLDLDSFYSPCSASSLFSPSPLSRWALSRRPLPLLPRMSRQHSSMHTQTCASEFSHSGRLVLTKFRDYDSLKALTTDDFVFQDAAYPNIEGL